MGKAFHYVLGALIAAQCCAAQVMLRGRVVDEDNAAVPNAQILLKAAAGAVRIDALTDPTGVFHAALPGPGNYLVSVIHTGFFPVSDRAIEVHAGANELLLSMDHVRNTSESVNVSGAPPLVSVEDTNAKRELGGPQVLAVPYPSTQDLKNALPLLPGVLKGPAGDLHFDGSSENQVQYTLDGFNISDPLTGTFAAHLPVESVRTLDFLSGRFSPEFGKGSTGVLAIRTESGDDALRYSATNFIPGVDTFRGLHVGTYTPRLNVSGPLYKGRAWFSDSVDGSYSQLIVSDLPKGQDSRTAYGASNLLHTQFNLTPANILFADLLANWYTTPNANLGALNPLPTTADLRNRQWFFSVKDQVYLTRGTLLEFGYADLRTFAREIPQGSDLYVVTPNGNRGNFYINSMQQSQRKQFLANLFLPALERAGRHQFKTGIDFDRLNYSQRTHRTGFENVDLAGNVLRRVMFAGSGVLERPNLEFSSYFLDNWRVRSNFYVEAGVRQDWDELVRSAAVSPRVSFSWAPFAKRHMKVAGGYAVTYDASMPQLFSRPQDQYSLTTLPGIYVNPAVTAFIMGPNLRMPLYQNWSLTWEQLLPGRIFLGVNLLRRRGRNGFTYVNVLNPGAPPANLVEAYHTTFFESIYQLQSRRRDQYDAAEIQMHQTFGKGYEWMVSYTRSRAFSNAVADITVDQPTLIPDNVGRLPWDAPNRFLSWGYLPTRWKNWAVAYLFETRSGFPFSVVDQIGSVVGPSNNQRYPEYFNLNLHVEWTVRLMSYRFALRGGFNNLTNHANWTAVNNTLGSPQYLTFFGSDGRHFVVRLRWLGRAKT